MTLYELVSEGITDTQEVKQALKHYTHCRYSHGFGRGWTIGNCSLKKHLAKVAKLGQFGSHAEIKAAASLCQKPVYVATDSLIVGKCTWTVFHPFPLAIVNMHMVNTNFIT